MYRGRGAGYIATLIVVHVHVLFCVNCDTNNQNQQQLLHKNSCGDIDNFMVSPSDPTHLLIVETRISSLSARTIGQYYTCILTLLVILVLLSVKTEDEEVEKEESEVRHRRKSIHTFWSEATIILIGQMLQTYAASTCFSDEVAASDGRLRNMTSLLEVHNALADGFDLKWRFDNYQQCRRQARCFSNYDQNATVGACERIMVVYTEFGPF
ncbi:hypothetical protein LOK49_Contig643G00001 [Camellia lanceoleosa]|nr:hypothetical protein LOK49_Contig643G00001 [Camellia lanceoleosa]